MPNLSAVLTSATRLEIIDRPCPEPAPNEVLVQIEAIGVCGSDVHYDEHGRIGNHVVERPMVVGHEAAGTVVAAGRQVRDRMLDERVAPEPGVPCLRCAQCLSGRYNLCPDVVFLATPPVDGAVAEFVTIDGAVAEFVTIDAAVAEFVTIDAAIAEFVTTDAAIAHPIPAGLDHEAALTVARRDPGR